MRYTTFRRASGLRVSRYALGTANFGTARGGGAEEDASRAMFERFADAGGTFIDTADIYSNGQPGPQAEASAAVPGMTMAGTQPPPRVQDHDGKDGGQTRW
jgi:aryl-alcohol dehydrogenase-like predicted oxidoreductase